MRAPRAVVLACSLVAVFAACLSNEEPCCTDDLDCAVGARCFEARCAPRCDEQTPCSDANAACVPEAGVCAYPERNVERDACAGGEDAR